MGNISLFYSFPKKGEPHVCDEVISVMDFLNFVKYGKWKDIIEPIREEKDKKVRSKMKTKLPSVTISGMFGERKESDLLEHSGFICIDIDDYKDKTPLLEDVYTFALMKSSSAGGLACLVKVNPEKHKESFKWLQNYYFKNYGIVVDPAPQNVASLRFVSYDPEIFINEKSKKALTLSLREKKKNHLPIVLPQDKVGEYVSEAVRLGKDLAPDYVSYRDLGFAIADGFGEFGREYFYALCSVSDKFDSRHANKQYNECLKGRKSGITVGTFYWMLKDAGIDIRTENKRYVQVATMGKEAKRSSEAVVKQLVELDGLNEKDAQQLVKEVYERNDIDIKKSIETPGELIEGIMQWMKLNHPIKRNEITGLIHDGKKDLTKERFNYIYLRARMFFNSKDITKDILDSIIKSEFTPNYNPITEYIENNKYRNSEGNIDKLIKSIRSDSLMKKTLIRKWLIGIIAAYNYDPVRSVLALIGGQNTGKTEWFRRLLPLDLQHYYGESKLDNGKDDELLMCQKLILIDDEMGGKSKQDEKRFKELTSKRIFSLRAPYAEHNEDFKRLALLGATSNENAILNDPTGNTRIFPIVVNSIDHELYNSIDKDELFMEIYRNYENGEDWKLTKDEMLTLNQLSSDFEQTPIERELIQKTFKHPEQFSANDSIKFLTSVEIKEKIEYNSNQKILNVRKFQSELSSFFGNSIVQKIDGRCVRGYQVVSKKNNDDNDELPF